MVSKPTYRHCAARVQLYKWCGNLSAGTVLQRCSSFSGVKTCHSVVSKPVCRHCVAEVQLFKQCQNLSAGTVLQGCSCLKGVKTYLPALCCRGAAVLVVSKPICTDCVAEVQLFKWCPNLSAGTVMQRCRCLSGVETFLPALCCRGAAVSTVLQPNCLALCCRDVAV